MMGAGACAQPYHSSTSAKQTASPKTLGAKISTAKAGETILLESGEYGPLAINGRRFDGPGIVIEPTPGAKASFSAISIGGSEGVTIKGVDVAIGAAQYGVNVNSSSRVVLSHLTVHAAPNTSLSAIMLRNSHDVTVQDCDIHDVGFGINLLASDHVTISSNTFSDLQVDAIRGAASHVEVVSNRASSFHPHPGDHPDFVQFWGGGAAGPSTANVIKDNVYERGDGDVVQGIFLEDNDDVVISGNALLGTMYNGIGLARVHRALVEDNFVQGYDDMGTRIITRGQSSDVTIRNNVAQSIVNYMDGGKPNPNYKEEHNHSIRSVKVGVTRDLQAWLAKRSAP